MVGAGTEGATGDGIPGRGEGTRGCATAGDVVGPRRGALRRWSGGDGYGAAGGRPRRRCHALRASGRGERDGAQGLQRGDGSGDGIALLAGSQADTRADAQPGSFDRGLAGDSRTAGCADTRRLARFLSRGGAGGAQEGASRGGERRDAQPGAARRARALHVRGLRRGPDDGPGDGRARQLCDAGA